MKPSNINIASTAQPTTPDRPNFLQRRSLYDGHFGNENRADPLLSSNVQRYELQDEILKQSDLEFHQRKQHSSDQNVDCNRARPLSSPKGARKDVKSPSSDIGILGSPMHYNGWKVTMEAFKCGLVSKKKCYCCSTEIIFFAHAQAVICPRCESILGIEPSDRKKLQYEVAKDIASISFSPEEKVPLCELSWTDSSQLLFLKKEYRGLALGLTREAILEVILEQLFDSSRTSLEKEKCIAYP